MSGITHRMHQTGKSLSHVNSLNQKCVGTLEENFY